jgi:hypothetical protein
MFNFGRDKIEELCKEEEKELLSYLVDKKVTFNICENIKTFMDHLYVIFDGISVVIKLVQFGLLLGLLSFLSVLLVQLRARIRSWLGG